MNYLNGNNIAEYLANTPQITFEITERCNLSCVYCGYGKLYSNKDMRTRSHTDGFRKNNVKCLKPKGICSFVPNSSAYGF